LIQDPDPFLSREDAPEGTFKPLALKLRPMELPAGTWKLSKLAGGNSVGIFDAISGRMLDTVAVSDMDRGLSLRHAARAERALDRR